MVIMGSTEFSLLPARDPPLWGGTVGGSRVVFAVPASGSVNPSFQLRMLDFNPSAMARGIGKVVRGSTFEGYQMDWREVVASLPYVEVVNNRVFGASIRDIILDEERMLIFSQARGGTMGTTDIEIFDM
ncbi:hypothetical protein M405DRAFT_882033 [Rhizopogon salebrosus TDB-379]|nr:hypothetical protein M405DRAFT_882033 [Rhizopogon salebrosus TDB-379]